MYIYKVNGSSRRVSLLNEGKFLLSKQYTEIISSILIMTPIAICGIGLRLSGGIHNTDEFWKLLVEGRDAADSPGTARFNLGGYDDSLGGKNSIHNHRGYFLAEDIGLFDPTFFSLTRKEAARCDPQQRLLLEVVRECLEDSGELSYRGKDIGCYVGTFGTDWLKLQNIDAQHAGSYAMTGGEECMIANRISSEYDLCGPR